MSTLCTICMRSGSKGVEGKNLKRLNGRPLLEYTIEQAINCKILDDIVISTDSKRIANISKNMGLDVWFKRPKKLSTDSAAKIPVIIHALKKTETHFKKRYSKVVDLDVTSPLRNIEDIYRSMDQFNAEGSSNLVTVCKARKNPYFNMLEKKGDNFVLVKESKKPFVRRQDAPDIYEMNASIYIWNRSQLLSNKPLINKNTSCYIMPEERSIDIDSESDFRYVEFLMSNNVKR